MLSTARSSGTHLSVAFADLDNFKRIVDSHGHLMGSQVLREVGEVMLAALSPDDTLVKYGGDEFVLLMPGKAAEPACARLERVRLAVAERRYLESTSDPVSLTASFGLATFPGDAANKKDLLLRADNAMYQAKKTKNAVAKA
jgi:diguanylate cyclase (GGDEF)-like protein